MDGRSRYRLCVYPQPDTQKATFVPVQTIYFTMARALAPLSQPNQANPS
jgi:hypothetical protein